MLLSFATSGPFSWDGTGLEKTQFKCLVIVILMFIDSMFTPKSTKKLVLNTESLLVCHWKTAFFLVCRCNGCTPALVICPDGLLRYTEGSTVWCKTPTSKMCYRDWLTRWSSACITSTVRREEALVFCSFLSLSVRHCLFLATALCWCRCVPSLHLLAHTVSFMHLHILYSFCVSWCFEFSWSLHVSIPLTLNVGT